MVPEVGLAKQLDWNWLLGTPALESLCPRGDMQKCSACALRDPCMIIIQPFSGPTDPFYRPFPSEAGGTFSWVLNLIKIA